MSDVMKHYWLKYDEYNGQWVYVEYFWILATNGTRHFQHFYHYGDDWDTANDMLHKMKQAKNFDPTNSDYWIEIVTTWTQKAPPPMPAKIWWARLRRTLESKPNSTKQGGQDPTTPERQPCESPPTPSSQESP